MSLSGDWRTSTLGRHFRLRMNEFIGACCCHELIIFNRFWTTPVSPVAKGGTRGHAPAKSLCLLADYKVKQVVMTRWQCHTYKKLCNFVTLSLHGVIYLSTICCNYQMSKMKLYLKALSYGSHRVTPANYTIPASTLRTFARWRHLNGRHLIPARYSFIDPGRMKGWVGLVRWPIEDVIPT